MSDSQTPRTSSSYFDIREARARIDELELNHNRLRAELAGVVETLQLVDGLIEYQFTGSREAMTALQIACDKAADAIRALTAAPKEKS